MIRTFLDKNINVNHISGTAKAVAEEQPSLETVPHPVAGRRREDQSHGPRQVGVNALS